MYAPSMLGKVTAGVTGIAEAVAAACTIVRGSAQPPAQPPHTILPRPLLPLLQRMMVS